MFNEGSIPDSGLGPVIVGLSKEGRVDCIEADAMWSVMRLSRVAVPVI